MTHEELKSWQDRILSQAKKTLKDQGRLLPLMFVLTKEKYLKNGVHPFLVAIRPDPGMDSKVADDEDSIALVPLNFGPEELLQFLGQAEPTLGKAIQECSKMAESLGLPQAEGQARIFRILCSTLRLEAKDIQAVAIVEILRYLKARAYVKVDEIWQLSMPASEKREDYPLNLKECETAGEAIMAVLECDDFRRMLTQPFQRTARNTGTVKSFDGEVIEVYEDLTKVVEDGNLGGRFIGLLQKSRTLPFKQKRAQA